MNNDTASIIMDYCNPDSKSRAGFVNKCFSSAFQNDPDVLSIKNVLDKFTKFENVNFQKICMAKDILCLHATTNENMSLLKYSLSLPGEVERKTTMFKVACDIKNVAIAQLLYESFAFEQTEVIERLKNAIRDNSVEIVKWLVNICDNLDNFSYNETNDEVKKIVLDKIKEKKAKSAES